MLLSDRDIRAELDSGRVGLDPLDPAMVQPASVDVRLDRFFRLFDNHRYAHIDPRQKQDELTRLVDERDELNIDFGRLQLEQATLAEANRVDRIAREKLGMKFPEAADIVVVRP